jgi:hypothetical protein
LLVLRVMRQRRPESQAFIESWFSKLKERCVCLHEFETLVQAREVIACASVLPRSGSAGG